MERNYTAESVASVSVWQSILRNVTILVFKKCLILNMLCVTEDDTSCEDSDKEL
jgi:hypothetical protein